MIDQQIEIPTNDGHTTTFITHPERGGPHPVIIFYMDAPAIREELRDMARRLGTSGYYVMLPNLYYRSGVMELGPLPADPESPERKRMRQLMASINIPLVMEDTKALLAFADSQAAARKDIVGSVGYCMSGQYAINAASHFPGRVKAAASIRANGDRREGKTANEGRRRQCRGRNLSRHPSRFCVSEAAGLRQGRRRASLGTTAGAVPPQSVVMTARCRSRISKSGIMRIRMPKT
jgi:dienelactone hydrolase